MESNGFNWNYIIPVLSIIIGWSLNQFSQFILSRNSDKRKLKSLLFNLLEMYHLLLRSDINKVLEIVRDAVMPLIPEESRTPQNKQLIFNFYKGLLEQHFNSDLEKDFNSIKGRYNTIIEELSEIDPTTAYYLSGKASFLERFENADAIKEKLIELYPNDVDEINHHTNNLLGQMKNDLLNETILDLESQLKHIGWRIGVFEWWRVKQTISSINKRVNETATKKMQEMVEQFKDSIYGNTEN